MSEWYICNDVFNRVASCYYNFCPIILLMFVICCPQILYIFGICFHIYLKYFIFHASQSRNISTFTFFENFNLTKKGATRKISIIFWCSIKSEWHVTVTVIIKIQYIFSIFSVARWVGIKMLGSMTLTKFQQHKKDNIKIFENDSKMQ